MTEHGLHTHQSRNLYEVLQLSPTASQEVIRAAYRTLARGFHPDVNPSPAAAEQMLRLNAAYHILSDNSRRADYDLHLARSQRPVASAFPHAVMAPATTTMRGRPRPDSPKRIEDERAANAVARSAPPGTRPRLLFVIGLALIVALMVTTVLWLTSQILDYVGEVPADGLAALNDAASRPRIALHVDSWHVGVGAAQPLLNHA